MAESNINDVVFVKLDHEKAQADPKASTSSQGQVYNPSMVPANVEVARKHGIAKKVYLSKRDDGKDEEGREVCVCCGLPVDGVPIPLMAGLEKLYHLGSGFALYFRFIKFTIALLILVLVVSGIFNLATNSKSGDCSESDSAVASYCTQGYILTYAIPNKRDEPEYLTAQAALNFVAIVLIVFFFHYLRYQFRKTEIAADDLTVTPSDYTIVIKEIPISTTNQEIIEWIQNIAMREKRTVSIEKIDRAYDVDEYISLARELNAMEGFKSQNQTRSPKIQERLKLITNLLGEMKNGKKEIKKCPVVFVTFTLAEHAAYIKNKFAGSRTFEIFKSKNTSGYDHIKGARVVVERAPEPSDVLWLNLGYTTRQRQIRGFFTNLAAFLLIILSCGIIILVKWAKDTASTTYGKGSATIQILSIVSSIVIVITNAILTFTIVYLTKMEKSLTNSEYLRGVAQKLSVALFLNTALTSLFAELILVENPGTDRVQAMNFYGKGGLIESIFWVFITNAFLGPLLTVFDFGYFLKLYKQRSLEKKGYNNKLTQKQANELFEGPVLNMPAKFAAMIQVILMTTFYAPALPFALLITSAGLFLKYWSEKYALLRRNKMPVSLNDELTDSMVEYLEWAACTFAVGNLIYIYTLKDSAGELAFSTDAKILAWVGLGISVLNVFFPMETVNNKLFPIKDDVTENDTYEKVRIEFTTDYDMENPVSKSKALDNFMQKVKGQQQPPQLAKTNTNEFEVPDDLSDRHLMKPIEPEIDFASLDSYAASTAKASDATKVSFFEYYILSRLNRFGF